MKTYNRIQVVGYVGRDPEASTTTSGTPIARFNVATTERWRGKDDTPQERTDWHRVVFFGPKANQIIDRIQKGALVFVEGSLRISTYDKDGTTRTSVEVRGTEWIDFRFRAPAGEVPLANDVVPPHADPPAEDDLPL
jgi:single-strand DNA-binding protein